MGLSAAASEDKSRLLAAARAALGALIGDDAPRGEPSAFWVPGRIEFLGKHTDYAGGRSLLCAVERGITVLATPRTDRRLRVVDSARPAELLDSSIDAGVEPPAGHWSTYPLTVARRIALNFPGPLLGADIAFASDLPLAAGLSSSSALVVAMFLALAEVNRLSQRREYAQSIHSPEELAGYLGAVENGQPFGDFEGAAGVGTFGGSEDHTAILCARPDTLVDYSFCPVRFHRELALPSDHEFVIASSGISAEKSGAAREQYNRASLAAQEIVGRWRDATGRADRTMADAVQSSPKAAGQMAAMLRAGEGTDEARRLSARLEQFVLESTQLVPRAGDALARGDLPALGAIVDHSQLAAERLLSNQTEETMWLARAARALGASAASAFGAGFGGSVWALVRSDKAGDFSSTWHERYVARFPERLERAMFFRTRAGPHAARLAELSR